jgi:hypothetical protein
MVCLAFHQRSWVTSPALLARWVSCSDRGGGRRSRWESRSAEAITVPEVRDLTKRGASVRRRWYHRNGAREASPSRRKTAVADHIVG